MNKNTSELVVITKAKELCSYIMIVTQKSPKQFRFTFVSRLQNLSLSIIENLFRANDIYVTSSDMSNYGKRLMYQQAALSDVKILCYLQCYQWSKNVYYRSSMNRYLGLVANVKN